MKFSWIAVAAAMLGLAMAIQPAFAGGKPDADGIIVRAKVLDGRNLEGCRFVDTVFGQAGGSMTYKKNSVLEAKADASENALAIGANAIVLAGLTVTMTNFVVMANAYACP